MIDSVPKPLLQTRELSAGYDGRPVIRNCSLKVFPGQVVLLMGRNGVGKTTLVSAISGRISTLAGEIEYNGQRVDHLPAFKRNRLGIAHVPQGREVIPKMSVRENLVLASASRSLSSEEADNLFAMFPVLHERLEQRAGTLSGGEQQMLAIGRAMLSRCKLVILDEPSLGLSPRAAEHVFRQVAELVSKLNLTVILVEQQVSWVWRNKLIDYVYVLENGTFGLEGQPSTINLEALEATYLGI